MAGHSQFANIKHRKGAQDKKRAKMFTKVAREIIVAAKSGIPDPQSNPRLRAAIAAARAVNMPKDKIETAIKRGSGDVDTESYEDMRYEGYAPGGVAIIVDVLTDNRNRAATDIRTIFSKGGGNMGESGSVAFMFEQVGLIEYPASTASAEEIFEKALEAGACDCESDEFMHHIYSEPDDFNQVRDNLAEIYGDADTGRLAFRAKITTACDKETAEKVLKLIDNLEDCDDVQYVASNADIPDEVLAALDA